MIKKFPMLLSVIGAVTFATTADADVISQTFSVGSQTSTNQIAYFDGNLGTLQSVSLSTAYSANGSYTVTNTGNGTRTGTALASYQLTVLNLDRGTSAFFDLYSNLPTYTSSTSYSLAAMQSQATVYASGLVSGSYAYPYNQYSYTYAADLQSFTAAGPMTFGAAASLNQQAYYTNANGSVDFMQIGDASGTYTLNYIYAPRAVDPTPAVPEPASWAMMILGFGIVGCALRRTMRASDRRFDARIRRIAAGELVA